MLELDTGKHELDTDVVDLGRGAVDNRPDHSTDTRPDCGVDVTHSESCWAELFSCDLSMGILADEEDHQLALDPFKELVESAFKDIPYVGKTKKGLRKARLRTYGEEDFDDLQRKIFILLRGYVHDTLQNSGKVKEALQWLFGIPEDDEIFSFDRCCQAMEADPDVVRARIQAEYYRRWLLFDTPLLLDFLSYPPPSEDITRATLSAGFYAKNLLEVVWIWPSIPVDKLRHAVRGDVTDDKIFLQTLEKLEHSSYIMEQPGGRLYYAGKFGARFHHAARKYFQDWDNLPRDMAG